VSRRLAIGDGGCAVTLWSTNRPIRSWRSLKEWYVLRSKPHKERSVRALLTRAGIEVFLPELTVRQPPPKPASREPLFPGYLFGSLDPGAGDFRLVRNTYGIRYIVSYGTDPCPVPTELVATLQALVERRQGKSAPVSFRPGDHVVIASGPFRGLEAIFDRGLPSHGRVIVFLRILQRICRVEVHARDLRPNQAAMRPAS
jgi:transcriptional antiterminator RfaH